MIKKTLSSGVECRIIPKKDYMGKQAMIAVKYGSDISSYSIDGRSVNLPAGTAHFIEHKMFDSQKGNMMQLFSDKNADVNAFTTFNETAYYFTCTENFYENLKLLTEMISNPFFDDRRIKSEKDIIASEIKMYEDDPQWCCYFGLLKALYSGLPVSDPVAGTVDEIQKIDAELLYNVYDSFYTPKNIILIAVGDVDENKVIDIAESTFSLTNDKNIITEDDFENCEQNENIEIYKEIKMPLFGIGIKTDNKPVTAENYVKTKLFLDDILGDRSDVFGMLYDKKLLDAPLNIEYLNGRCYNAVMLTGSSPKPEETAKYLSEALKQTKRNIGSSIKNTAKKHLGSMFMQQDDLDMICNSTAACFAKGFDILDIYDIYDKILKDKISEFDLSFSGEPKLSIVRGKR